MLGAKSPLRGRVGELARSWICQCRPLLHQTHRLVQVCRRACVVGLRQQQLLSKYSFQDDGRVCRGDEVLDDVLGEEPLDERNPRDQCSRCWELMEQGQEEEHCSLPERRGWKSSRCKALGTGGEGAFTQWVHGEFMVSSEVICPPNTHWAHAEYF